MLTDIHEESPSTQEGISRGRKQGTATDSATKWNWPEINDLPHLVPESEEVRVRQKEMPQSMLRFAVNITPERHSPVLRDWESCGLSQYRVCLGARIEAFHHIVIWGHPCVQLVKPQMRQSPDTPLIISGGQLGRIFNAPG